MCVRSNGLCVALLHIKLKTNAREHSACNRKCNCNCNGSMEIHSMIQLVLFCLRVGIGLIPEPRPNGVAFNCEHVDEWSQFRKCSVRKLLNLISSARMRVMNYRFFRALIAIGAL